MGDNVTSQFPEDENKYKREYMEAKKMRESYLCRSEYDDEKELIDYVKEFSSKEV